MGNPKQKWRAEEEKALIDGIERHGAGKWKLIKTDPDFSHLLSNRTNIDLKDKWRNLNAALRAPKPKPTQDAPAALPRDIHTPPVLPVPQEPVINQVIEESVKDIPEAENASRYYDDNMIFEAFAAAKGQDVVAVSSIVAYIKSRVNVEVPHKLRQSVTSRLKTLARNGRLEKLENGYRLNSRTVVETKTSDRKDILPRQPFFPSQAKDNELIEEAAKTAAFKVAEAEAKTYFAALSVREIERLSKMQEEADSIFQLAQEIFERCHSKDVRVVA